MRGVRWETPHTAWGVRAAHLLLHALAFIVSAPACGVCLARRRPASGALPGKSVLRILQSDAACTRAPLSPLTALFSALVLAPRLPRCSALGGCLLAAWLACWLVPAATMQFKAAALAGNVPSDDIGYETDDDFLGAEMAAAVRSAEDKAEVPQEEEAAPPVPASAATPAAALAPTAAATRAATLATVASSVAAVAKEPPTTPAVASVPSPAVTLAAGVPACLPTTPSWQEASATPAGTLARYASAVVAPTAEPPLTLQQAKKTPEAAPGSKSGAKAQNASSDEEVRPPSRKTFCGYMRAIF